MTYSDYTRRALADAMTLYEGLCACGRITKLKPVVAKDAIQYAIDKRLYLGVVASTFFTQYLLELEEKIHQPESTMNEANPPARAITNADRNILCQTIDAKLEAPNAERVSQWFKLAGREPGGITMSVQTGVAIEEIVEFLQELTISGVSGALHNVKVEAQALLTLVADALKAGESHVYIADRVAAVDAMCDVDVTLNGIAYLGGFDKAGADRRVIDSLFDKFNADGTPVIKVGGKIGKRDGWEAPDLTKFAGEMPGTPESQQPFTYEGVNPQEWAKAFMKTVPVSGIDEGKMIGWFATAFEEAREFSRRAAMLHIESEQSELMLKSNDLGRITGGTPGGPQDL